MDFIQLNITLPEEHEPAIPVRYRGVIPSVAIICSLVGLALLIFFAICYAAWKYYRPRNPTPFSMQKSWRTSPQVVEQLLRVYDSVHVDHNSNITRLCPPSTTAADSSTKPPDDDATRELSIRCSLYSNLAETVAKLPKADPVVPLVYQWFSASAEGQLDTLSIDSPMAHTVMEKNVLHSSPKLRALQQYFRPISPDSCAVDQECSIIIVQHFEEMGVKSTMV